MSEETASEYNELTTCQNCGASDPNLTKVESGLKLSLAQGGRTDIPQSVCAKCLKELRNSASQGAQLHAKQEAKQKQTHQLWTGRTELVRQGRRFLQRGEYAEAAVTYEKYLKIISIVVKKNRADLDPKQFNEHPKEITIISSVLWDLMLIYDSHAKFFSKQKETAELLSKFLRFSPVYNGIIRKAEREIRKAKNPPAFHHLLKLCDVHASRCFIANATFGSRMDPTVVTLCWFRDEVLKKFPLGRSFVAFYYRHSPSAAMLIKQHPQIKGVARPVLRGVAIVIKTIFH